MPSVISSVQTLKLSSSLGQRWWRWPRRRHPAPARSARVRSAARCCGDRRCATRRRCRPSSHAAKSPNGPGRRRPHITQVSGAIPGGNIHTAAERDGQVGVVAADPDALVEHLPCRPGGARILIIESDMVVDIIADRLCAGPPRRRLAEKVPSCLGQQIRLAIPAAQQKDQSLFRADPLRRAVAR